MSDLALKFPTMADPAGREMKDAEKKIADTNAEVAAADFELPNGMCAFCLQLWGSQDQDCFLSNTIIYQTSYQLSLFVLLS